MKKKLLSLMAVSAVTVIVCGALVACGGYPGNSGNSDNGGGNGQVTTTVTKAQWAAAISLGNFGSNVKINVVTVEAGKGDVHKNELVVGAAKYGDYSMSYTIFTAEGEKSRERAYVRIVEANRDAEYSFSGRIVDGDWQDGGWSLYYSDHETYDDEEWTQLLHDTGGFSDAFFFADKYDSFKYENGVYVLKDAGGIDITPGRKATDMKISFADGKWVAVELTMVYYYDDSDDIIYPMTIDISYGAQTIAAPEGAVEITDDE